ncbi:MAG: carbamoyl phosphate synthase small subunit [Oscillospiraceae bacterium]|nr:carbamoyl phosphate synthase small subunit [Oscillospiraceae bacterium]
MSKKAYLILEDGTKMEGKLFGTDGNVNGEVVFNTGMSGFQEMLSDPNYRGKIVMSTFPSVGNAGANGEDVDSDYSPLGFIVRDYCEEPSNFRSEESLDEFMKKRGIVGLYGVDTRRLTRILRERGALNGTISTNPKVTVGDGAFDAVFLPTVEEFKVENPRYNLALINFGARNSLIKLWNDYGCSLCTADDIDYDGVLICGGDGNPADYPEQLKMIKALIKSGMPIFGAGLGHLLLAVAAGESEKGGKSKSKVRKLKCGHRSSNQPVSDKRSGNVYLTRQNHGYVVESIPADVGEVILENVNDKTVEGIVYKQFKGISTQFDPSRHGGTRHTKYLIEEFIQLIGNNE